MGGKIDVYLDSVSPYSYFALVELRRNEAILKQYGVDVEFFPIFLGGVNVATGNKPPGSVPAKAKFSPYDLKRAAKHFNLPNLKTPSTFPILSLLPQRAMTYVKDKYPKAKFEDAFQELWVAFWEQSSDISQVDVLQKVLARHFSDDDVKEILEATKSPEYKQKLLDNTQKAVDLGAFGAPWMWVKNGKGEEEPFFGSDRFHYLWAFLDIPSSKVAITPKPKI